MEEETVSENTVEEETVSENTTEIEESISENAIAATMQMSSMEVEANNGLGSLLMDEIQFAADAEKSEMADSYAIAEITVEGNTADVRLHVADDCVAVVGIYAEDGEKLIASGRQYVQTGSSQVDVTIGGEMPTYYVVKGYLVEAESQRPLSKVYETRTYTKVMQDFLKKTTADFDADRVVNLDEDEKTNFAVVGDGNKRILEKTTGEKTVNQLTAFDEAALTYTFVNADETLSGLTAGEIFVWQGEDGSFLVIKVKNITVNDDINGDKIVVVEACADELAADDVFSYVKIEESIGTDDISTVDTASCPEGVTYLGRGDAEGYALSGDESLKLTSDRWKLELKPDQSEGIVECKLEAALSIKVTLKYYFAVGVWDVDFGVEAEVSVGGTLTVEGKISVPLCAALEAKSELFTVQYIPTFVLGLTFEGSIQSSGTATFGVRAGNQGNSGFYAYSEVKLFELGAEADGYIGFEFNPKLEMKGVFHAELLTGVHLGVKASVNGGVSGTTQQEREEHECGIACVAGEIYLGVPFEGKLQILKFKELVLEDCIGIETEGSREISLGKFYWSILHGEFGWGECPHKTKERLITVHVTAGSKPVRGAKVWCSRTVDAEIVGQASNTRVGGTTSLWMSEKKYSPAYPVLYIFASYRGCTAFRMLNEKGPQTVELKLPETGGDLKVKQVYGGNCHGNDGFSCIMEDDSLYAWGRNSQGAVGTGNADNQNKPVRILDDVRTVIVDDDNDGRAAILNNGDLYVWGIYAIGIPDMFGEETLYGPIKIAERVKGAALGCGSGAFVKENGELYMWGDLEELGIGGLYSEPVKILDSVKTVSSSIGIWAAIRENGDLYMWGNNDWGQIGNGTIVYQKSPVKILENVKSVSLGIHHVAAIQENSDLYIWGDMIRGDDGDGKREDGSVCQWTPKKIMGNVKSVHLDPRSNSICAAITERDELYMWGYNVVDSEGNGVKEYRPSPVKVWENVKDVIFYDGNDCGIVVQKDGVLYEWKWNYFEEGEGESADAHQMLKLAKVTEDVKEVAVGNIGIPNATFGAIKQDGYLYTWGYNLYGLLGQGISDTAAVIATPTKVDFSTADDVTQLVKAASVLVTVMAENEETADTQANSFVELEPSYTAQNLTAAQPAAISGDGALRTAHFSGLRAQDIYNVYALKKRDCEKPLAPDNLLYITQAVSGADGNLSLTFEMKETYEEPEVFCVGYTQTDISGAQATTVNFVYDGEEHIAETAVILDGQTLRAGVDYEVYGDVVVKEMGKYELVLKGKGIYCGEIVLSFYVNENGENPNPDDPEEPGNGDVLPEDMPADGVIPRGLWMAGVAEGGYDYTGTAIKPLVRVYDYKTLLQEKRDYTISYKNNIKAFEVSQTPTDAELKKAPTITVSGKGNYTGKDTQTFSIHALDISAGTEENLFEADELSVVSGKKAQKPVPTLWWNGKKLKKNTDYTYTYHQGTYAGTDTAALVSVKDAGIYYIKITGKGNFTGELRVKLTLLAAAGSVAEEKALKPASKLTVAKIPGQDYLTQAVNGKVTPLLTVRDGKTTLTEGTHFTVSYSNNGKPGTAYAIVKGLESGGYSGTKRVSFKINGVAIKKAVVKGMPKNLVYNGAAQEPTLTLTVKLNGVETTLVKDTDYTLQWKNNKGVGTATVTFTGKNAYSGTLKKTVKIKAFDIKANQGGNFQAALKSDSVPYAKGGAKPALTVTFKSSDQTTGSLKEGTDFTLSYKNNKALNDGSNAAKMPTVVVKGKGNFAGTFAQTLTYKITQQSLDNLTLSAADKVYRNKKNIFSTKVKVYDVDGKALSAGRDYNKKLKYAYKNDTKLDNGTVRTAGTEVDKNDIIPAGTVLTVTAAALTPSGKQANYTGSCMGEYSFRTYDIAKARVTIPAQTYTGKAITLDKTDEKQLLVKVSGKKVEPSQFEIVAGSYKNNVKKGTASVTIRGVDNYGGTKNVTFRIKAKGFLWWWRN